MELTPRDLDEDEAGTGGGPSATDLSPRGPDGARPRKSGRRRLLPALVLVGVVGALGVIVFKALDSATTYFYNADEAVERKESLGESRFRLQGMVMDDVEATSDGVAFSVVHECVVVQVRHSGDPPQLFQPGESAVVEGSWDASGDYVASDRVLVAHDEEYQAEDEYADRVEEAESGGAYDLTDCPDLEPISSQEPEASGQREDADE